MPYFYKLSLMIYITKIQNVMEMQVSRLPIKSEATHLFETCDIFELKQIETLPITVNDIAQQTISEKNLITVTKSTTIWEITKETV